MREVDSVHVWVRAIFSQEDRGEPEAVCSKDNAVIEVDVGDVLYTAELVTINTPPADYELTPTCHGKWPALKVVRRSDFGTQEYVAEDFHVDAKIVQSFPTSKPNVYRLNVWAGAPQW